jgi:ABC-type Na+ efflux pump permease subunit
LVAAPGNDLAVILRPFLLIASVAFVMGFAGYLAFGYRGPAAAQDRLQDRLQAPVTVAEPIAAPSNRPMPV